MTIFIVKWSSLAFEQKKRTERPENQTDLFEQAFVRLSALSENQTFGFRTLTVRISKNKIKSSDF